MRDSRQRTNDTEASQRRTPRFNLSHDFLRKIRILVWVLGDRSFEDFHDGWNESACGLHNVVHRQNTRENVGICDTGHRKSSIDTEANGVRKVIKTFYCTYERPQDLIHKQYGVFWYTTKMLHK